MIVETVNYVLSQFTLIGLIFIILSIFYEVLRKKIKIKSAEKLRNFLKKESLLIILIISSIATLGSLFFSEIALYEPCKLCWFQRIFMYPIPIISLIGLLKKQKPFIYILTLSLIGFSISLYHNITRFSQLNSGLFCQIGSNCSITYFTYFNFITIPIMSLTAFSLIILFSYKNN
ncbi:MAG: disulfide bond formation protein B [Candidatus Aenigmarchaeota archaeon]|nr:disulfide bond formation protein B [Candidatus Aenigmarchaeota archaeon]